MWSVSQVFSQSANGSGGHSGEIKSHLIDVAPAPVFARLVRLDDGMFGCVEVLRGVPVLGRIAAADVAAGHAQAQMNPGVTALQAFFTSARMGFHISNLIRVRAFLHRLPS
jgi:hypothetical protein